MKNEIHSLKENRENRGLLAAATLRVISLLIKIQRNYLLVKSRSSQPASQLLSLIFWHLMVFPSNIRFSLLLYIVFNPN